MRWHIGSYDTPEAALDAFLASEPDLSCWGHPEESGLCRGPLHSVTSFLTWFHEGPITEVDQVGCPASELSSYVWGEAANARCLSTDVHLPTPVAHCLIAFSGIHFAHAGCRTNRKCQKMCALPSSPQPMTVKSWINTLVPLPSKFSLSLFLYCFPELPSTVSCSCPRG